MTAPRPAITRDRYHRYGYLGATYPGVTGAVGILDKPAIANWMARLTAEAAVELLGELPKIMLAVGPDGVVAALTKAAGTRSDAAKNAGSAIHGLMEDVVRGQDRTAGAPPEIRGRVLAASDWWASSGWRLRLAEAFIVNPTLGYGGTIDLLAYDEKGKTVLADWKTGSGVYHETRLQLAGYGLAEVIAPQDSPRAYPMPAVERYAVLHVTDGGVSVIDVDVDDEDREAFRACLPLSRWHAKRKGRLAA